MSSLTSTKMRLKGTDNGVIARGISALAGLWLLISAFAWPHTSDQMNNSLIVGVLAIIAAAVAAFVMQEGRYANTALSVWLFISAFVLQTVSNATLWNNVIVAIVMFACSLVPGAVRSDLLHRRRGVLHPRT